MNLEPGTIIAGAYRIDRRIGAGGMGEVWSAERLEDGLRVAVKILLASISGSGEVVARFRREAQVLARIRSKYVASVLDFVTDESFGFVLVMELIPGDSLHAVLSTKGHLTVETTLDIVSDVLRGLRDLHASNIVHRDLKPGNIVLRPRPNLRPRATLIDFGVSRIMSNPDEEEITAITRGDRVLGTLEYMAPEQILGSRTVTGTADLYAVGAMMYRAIAGHHVFGTLAEGHLAVAKLNEDAPPLPTGRTDPLAQRVVVLLSRLLSRRLRDRFENADQVITEVDEIRALARVRVAAPEIEVTDDTTLETNFPVETTSVDEISIHPIEAHEARISKAAIPIPPSDPNPAGPAATRSAAQSQEPSSSTSGPIISVSSADAPPATPMAGSIPRPRRRLKRRARGPGWGAIVGGGLLFVVGSVGGVLFGASYAGGGPAYSWLENARGWLGTAPASSESPSQPQPQPQPPATSVALVASAAPLPNSSASAAPVASGRDFELDEVPVGGSAAAAPSAPAPEPVAAPSAPPEPSAAAPAPPAPKPPRRPRPKASTDAPPAPSPATPAPTSTSGEFLPAEP